MFCIHLFFILLFSFCDFLRFFRIVGCNEIHLVVYAPFQVFSIVYCPYIDGHTQSVSFMNPFRSFLHDIDVVVNSCITQSLAVFRTQITVEVGNLDAFTT